ncbi:hypothetical protein TH63_00165 [Rufibacter radiotolerans]|uniref:Uncharacterized protein n=1 Tax=Rufibacter radiotolerans TaxID=1379910 RepID=A0A0H4VFL2_9BACT|nr:hypothetical protein [Rufibacter radiotolerans]AKQ44405.1 hypothetical protein TH63_00165 [Rufibacter radiotolerans]
MRKKTLLAFTLFFSCYAFAQEPFIIIQEDDGYPLKGPRRYLAVDQQNEINFQLGKRIAAGSLLIQNGKIDSLLLNPEDSYTYYLIPDAAGPVIVQAEVCTQGQKSFKTETSTFEAIVTPLVEVRLLKNEYAKHQRLRFGLFDKSTGKPLPKRYRAGGFFDVEVYDKKGTVVARAPMQSGTTIFLTPFPEPIPIEEGHFIRFSFPIRDFKTGILFSSAEVVHTF